MKFKIGNFSKSRFPQLSNEIICLLGFLIGITIESFTGWGWGFILFFGFLGSVFGVFYFVNHTLIRKPCERWSGFLLLTLFFLSIFLGMARYEIKNNSNDFGWLENKIDQTEIFEGVIVDEPDEREKYMRLVVEVSGPVFAEATEKQTVEKKSNTKVLVYTKLYPKFNYGDKVELKGKIQKPKNSVRHPMASKEEVGSVRDFDWKSYLAKDEIYFEMFYPQVELVSSKNGNFIKAGLLSIKQKYLDGLGRIIPEPHASFVGGLTIGAKQSIPVDLQEDFKRTGTIHMIVLSGYNITLVINVIMRILSFLPQSFGISLSVVGIILFAIMTGGTATVIRASIMAIFVLIARWSGRIYGAIRALFIAGFLMVLHNPKILVFDTSFQLSFLATLALIYVYPVMEEMFKKILRTPCHPDESGYHSSKEWWTAPKAGGRVFKYLKTIPEKLQLRDIILSTISVQLFVLPLLLYKIGDFSIVALPVNILILPVIPATMFFGFITGILGMVPLFGEVGLILATPFAWLSYAFLRYETWVVEIFAKLPFASFTIPYFPLWLMVWIYCVFAFIIYKFGTKKLE